ncbi:hypothetical protein [Microseira wollei]|nr:hypothetical protein [Microseira wollei]
MTCQRGATAQLTLNVQARFSHPRILCGKQRPARPQALIFL